MWPFMMFWDDLIHHSKTSFAHKITFPFREKPGELFDFRSLATAHITMCMFRVDEKRLPELFEVPLNWQTTIPTNCEM
jgi:hypothetical protein